MPEDFVGVAGATWDIILPTAREGELPNLAELMAEGAHGVLESGSSADPRHAEVIPAYYRYIDHTLGQIRELTPEDATIVIVSDHGGGPLKLEHAFHLQMDVLLEILGLMSADGGDLLAIDELYLHDKRIWLNLEGIEAGGTVPLSEAPTRAHDIAVRLGDLRTDRDEPLLESVEVLTDRSDCRQGDPALVVRFSPAALLTETVRDGNREHDFAAVRMRHSDVTGEHLRDGILLVHGPGIRRGALDGPASIYHVAPTLLYLLGLPQDGRMLRWAPADGGVLEAILDPELLASRPITTIADYSGTDRSQLARRRQSSPEDPSQVEAMERLRSLGYIR